VVVHEGEQQVNSYAERIASHPRSQRAPVFFLILLIIVFYGYGRWAIANYYDAAIPHYDSVGAYLRYFTVLDAVHQYGLVPAIPYAFADALSPLQSIFTLAFSPFLSKSMSSFHLYNTLCFIPAVFGMYAAARSYRCSAGTSVLFACLLLLPGGMYYWDLGVFDFRRDPGTYFLMVGALFFAIAYFTGEASSKRRRLAYGICTGVSAGLCLLSRDSAFGFLLGVVILPAVGMWAINFRRKSVRDNFVDLIPVFASFIPFVFIWGLFVDSMLSRILNPYLYYGAGNDGRVTIADNAAVTYFLITDLHHSYYWLASKWETLKIMVGFAVLVAGIFLFSRKTPQERAEPQPVSLSATSRTVTLVSIAVFIVLYVNLFLAFAVGWLSVKSRSILEVSAPYYPSMAAFLVICLLGLTFLPRSQRMRVQVASAVLALALITIGMHTRSQTRKPEYPDWFVAAHEDVGRMLAAKSGTPYVVAEMASDFRMPAVQLYAVQNGAQPPQRLFYQFDGRGHDFFVAGPEDPAKNAGFEAAMEEAVLCRADFILTFADMSRYQMDGAAMYLESSGTDVVNRITGQLEDAPKTYYGETPEEPFFRVIDNRARSACETAG